VLVLAGIELMFFIVPSKGLDNTVQSCKNSLNKNSVLNRKLTKQVVQNLYL